MKRDWRYARAKIELEGGICRVCTIHGVDAAHVTFREHDRKAPLGYDEDREGPWVEPYEVVEARIVPLCRPCHTRYDGGELDLVPYLRLEEELQAVADMGRLEAARMRLSRPLYPSKLPARHPEESVL